MIWFWANGGTQARRMPEARLEFALQRLLVSRRKEEVEDSHRRSGPPRRGRRYERDASLKVARSPSLAQLGC